MGAGLEQLPGTLLSMTIAAPQLEHSLDTVAIFFLRPSALAALTMWLPDAGGQSVDHDELCADKKNYANEPRGH